MRPKIRERGSILYDYISMNFRECKVICSDKKQEKWFIWIGRVTGRKDYKWAQGNICELWMCLLFWCGDVFKLRTHIKTYSIVHAFTVEFMSIILNKYIC